MDGGQVSNCYTLRSPKPFIGRGGPSGRSAASLYRIVQPVCGQNLFPTL
jgi:hypothetical protein